MKSKGLKNIYIDSMRGVNSNGFILHYLYIFFLRSIQLYFVSFFFSLEPVVWEIAALVRTESSLLTTDTLAVILVAGITKLIISLTFPSSPFPKKKKKMLYFIFKLN